VIAQTSVWSDPEVVELLQHFVPVADEVHRLQKGSDPRRACFKPLPSKATMPPWSARTYRTRQGTYAAAPSGVLLASINSNDPRAMAACCGAPR
jgi:hypothetical protein